MWKELNFEAGPSDFSLRVQLYHWDFRSVRIHLKKIQSKAFSVAPLIVSSEDVLSVRQEEAAVSLSSAKEKGVDAALSDLDNIMFSTECFSW